jgi:hypothetical protein
MPWRIVDVAPIRIELDVLHLRRRAAGPDAKALPTPNQPAHDSSSGELVD